MKTKGELYHYLGSIRGTVFVDSGNILLVEMLKNFNGEIIQYGQGKKSLCSGKIINNFPAITVQINIQGDKEEKYTFPTKLSGGYNLENILAAFCVGLHFNVPGFEMADAVSSYSPGLMRSQLIHTRNNTIIMDAYNANPTSMDAAIQDFAADPDPDKLLVLGEMKELGDTAVEEHRHLIGMISDLGFRDVILIGQLFSQEGFPGYFRFFKKTGDCMDWLQNHPVNGKKILIKGSRLMELEKLMPYL